MSKLTTKERNSLPDSDFVGPDRSYPIPDKSHARNAKARASQFASGKLKAKVDKAADKKLKSPKPFQLSKEIKKGGKK